MGDLLQPWHILILLFVASWFLVPVVFYILVLQRALNKCDPTSRTIDPGIVWLAIIPIVSLVANFFIVLGMSKSLRNEFNRRGLPVTDPTPGQSIGVAMCVCACCQIIPVLGLISGLASMVLWIIYWVKIAEYSRALDAYSQPISPASVI